MKIRKSFILCLLLLLTGYNPSYSIIKLDNESVDLAIKYSFKTKNNSAEYILGPNWINDGTGRILNIYSPFIQLVIKSQNHNFGENAEKDVSDIKSVMNNDILKIKNKNEVRFIVSIYGDKENFAEKYKAYITDKIDENNKNIIKPKKFSNQKIAEKDFFNRKYPYSAINCYIFKFNDLEKLKEYYFVLVSEQGDEIKYKINNNEIF